MNNKIKILFYFLIIFVFQNSLTLASEYLACPNGAIAFSTLDSFDKLCINILTNNREKVIELIESDRIKIIEPGEYVRLLAKESAVSTIQIRKSSKIWVVPNIFLKDIYCENGNENEKTKRDSYKE